MVLRRVIALLLAIGCGAAQARSERYTFDKVHSQIQFHVSHLGFSMSEGEFHDWDGSFRFDPEDWSTATVDVTIKVDSLDMDNAGWNRVMLGKKYFNAKAHPTMRFVGTQLRQIDAKRGSLLGELTLLGVTRPVTLEVSFNRVGVHPYSGLNVAGFSASTVIQRSDFGMPEAIPDVGDEVRISLEIEGTRSATKRGK